jgi:hypothetical protein
MASTEQVLEPARGGRKGAGAADAGSCSSLPAPTLWSLREGGGKGRGRRTPAHARPCPPPLRLRISLPTNCMRVGVRVRCCRCACVLFCACPFSPYLVALNAFSILLLLCVSFSPQLIAFSQIFCCTVTASPYIQMLYARATSATLRSKDNLSKSLTVICLTSSDLPESTRLPRGCK